MLASVLSDSMLAGWLAGAARATRGLPPAVPPPGKSPSLAPASQPPERPPSLPTIAGASTPEPVVHFPIIEEAADDLETRRILTRPEFDQLATDAKTTAFTAARVANEEALQRLSKALAVNVAEGGTLKDFRDAVDEALGPDFLSPGHIENVFRTNIAQAYSTGLMETLAHPLVADEFPYVAYHAVHDSRTRSDHLAMERLGLDETNVYRRDDPVWERFTPPWDYQCRCAIVPMTVQDAARAGVREAKEWIRYGIPPASPAWVSSPPFAPPLGWNTRTVIRMSEDDEGHEHGADGKFVSKGARKDSPKQERKARLQSLQEARRTYRKAVEETTAHLRGQWQQHEKAVEKQQTALQSLFDRIDPGDEETEAGEPNPVYLRYEILDHWLSQLKQDPSPKKRGEILRLVERSAAEMSQAAGGEEARLAEEIQAGAKKARKLWTQARRMRHALSVVRKGGEPPARLSLDDEGTNTHQREAKREDGSSR